MRLPLIPAQRIPLCLPLATRKTSIQTPQVQTPLTTATQQKQERFLNLPGCSPCSKQPLNRPQKINHTRTLFPLPIPEKKMPLWLPLIPVKKMPLPPPLTTRARRQKNIPGVKTHRKPPSPTRPGHSTPPQRSLKNKCRSPWPALTTGAHLRKISTLTLRGLPLFTTPTTRRQTQFLNRPGCGQFSR